MLPRSQRNSTEGHPHSGGLRCRVLQDVLKTLTSLSASRVTFRSSSCFLALCRFVCLLHSSPLLQFLLDAYTCIRVCFSSCNRKTFVLFYCLFPFAEGMRMAVFRDCLVRGTWRMARSVELTGWLQGSSGKEPEWH